MKLYKKPKSFSYIGSKIKLLDFIGENIEKYTNKPLDEIKSFADLFSGTGVVGYYMIQNDIPKVISNDIQYYAHVISSIWISKNVDLDKMKTIINDTNEYISKIKECDIIDDNCNFVYNNYSPKGNRMFFTKLNAYKIDKIRQRIEELNSLTTDEYHLLIKILLYAVISVSNIASTFGSFIKKFKNTALKDISLNIEMLDLLINCECDHTCFNKDIIELLDTNDLSDIEVCYLDSPYNNRKYSANYFVLEAISKYDNPELKGKTGNLVKEESGAKLFCSKTTAKQSFTNILNKIKSKYVFISYNSESIIPKSNIIQILEQTGWEKITCIEKNYTRFKSNNNGKQEKTVVEYLFCATHAKSELESLDLF